MFSKYVIAFQRSKTLKCYHMVVLRMVFANLPFPAVRIDRCESSPRSASFCRCMICACLSRLLPSLLMLESGGVVILMHHVFSYMFQFKTQGLACNSVEKKNVRFHQAVVVF